MDFRPKNSCVSASYKKIVRPSWTLTLKDLIVSIYPYRNHNEKYHQCPTDREVSLKKKNLLALLVHELPKNAMEMKHNKQG